MSCSHVLRNDRDIREPGIGQAGDEDDRYSFKAVVKA